MAPHVKLRVSFDQACAINNALRREIAHQERNLRDKDMIGVAEYLRHLDGALQQLSRAIAEAGR